jgi:hypothetical protein
VSDAGLVQIKEWKNLRDVSLTGTQVSDNGLVHFKNCENLASLWLQRTKVTREKIEELRKVLPKCKIEWGEK